VHHANPAARLPTADDLLSSRVLKPLGASGSGQPSYELAPGNTVRVLYGEEGKWSHVYVIRSTKEPFDQVDVIGIDRPHLGPARPLSTEQDDQARLLYWEQKPQPRIWWSDGAAVRGALGEAAFVYADSSMAGVEAGRLVRVQASGSSVSLPLAAPPGARLLGFRAGALVWLGPRNKEGKAVASVQFVPAGRGPVSPPQELGPVPADVTELLACRSRGVLSLVMHSTSPLPEEIVYLPDVKQLPDSRTSFAAIFHDAQGWHGPAVAEHRVEQGRWVRSRGFPADGWLDYEPKLSCRGLEATLTWPRRDNRIAQLRCNPAGCESAASGYMGLIGSLGALRLGDLDGKALAVWAVSDPSRLGSLATTQLKLAPLGEIAQGPWRVILDDATNDLEVVAGDGAAVILSGGRGIRVSAEGKITALVPAWLRESGGKPTNSWLGKPPSDSLYSAKELEAAGLQFDQVERVSWTACDGHRCACFEPQICTLPEDCLSLERNLDQFRKALAEPNQRTVSCVRAEVGRCGEFRYFYFAGDIDRYEQRWFDASGKLVGQRNWTDYPAYCGRRTNTAYSGFLPKCAEMKQEELLCGEAKQPLRPPLEDLRGLLGSRVSVTP
jgi:hypothetical protein